MNIADNITRMTRTYRRDLSDIEVDEWLRVLTGCEPVFVTAAVDEWIATEKWMATPADIRREATRLSYEASNAKAEPAHHRRDSFRCPKCQDIGYRTVWHPRAMRAAVEHARGTISESRLRRQLYTCVVSCTCDSGMARRMRTRDHNERSKNLGQCSYRDDLMIEYDHAAGWTHRLDSLLDWAREYREPVPANHAEWCDEFR